MQLRTDLADKELLAIKNFFDGIFYPFVHDLFLHPVEPTYFPAFLPLQKNVHRLNTPYLFYFTLFKLGQSADDSFVRKFIPKAIFEIMVEAGLLIMEEGEWRTPGLSVLPMHGTYCLVPLPGFYPTALYKNYYPDFKITQHLHSLVPFDKVESLVDIGDQNYGIAALSFSKVTRRNSLIYSTDLEISTIISFNIGLNGLSGKVRLIDTLDNLNEPLGMAFVNPLFFSENIASKSVPLTSLNSIVDTIKRIPLVEDGEIVLLFNIIGERTQIPSMKEITEEIKTRTGLYSKVVVLEKTSITSFFNSSFKVSLPPWNEIAGYKDNYYSDAREKWLNDCQITQPEDKFVYRVLCKLTPTIPQFKFITIYQPYGSDPLYAVSTNSYNL